MKLIDKEHQILYIFNLETDLESQVLASTHSWIIEFAQSFDKVIVWSTKVGKTKLPSNVEIHELGGGSPAKKVVALAKLCGVAIKMYKKKEKIVVFHHMSHYTALILGIPIRLMGITQGLWYSHSKGSLGLKIGSVLMDHIFTSTGKTLPLSTKKTHYIGHGIDTSKFARSACQNRGGMISVGRIAPIKHLESGIEAIEISMSKNYDFTLLGPQTDLDYLEKLRKKARESQIRLNVTQGVNQNELPAILNKYTFYFSGTPASVDKATLEAALCGCIPISENEAVHELTGMWLFWAKFGYMGIPDNSEQLRKLNQLELEELQEISISVSTTTASKNDVKNTCGLIARILLSHK
jgi:glycosyltransferase involved in cell wall biosynthesis